MKIHNGFVGGNIRVKEIVGDDVYLENELRDTAEGKTWFYWAFCVEGAEGRRLTFHLGDTRLGYHGPAVSHDLYAWRWLGELGEDGESFSYCFGEDEGCVYFAHHLLYHPERFLSFAERKGLKIETLCTSRKGREIPCVRFGEGDTMILTARHHACESTGDYILEGVLDELCREPILGLSVLCVPFVDYDGVLDGDQGKNRAPHDHNRDYVNGVESIHSAPKAIRAYMDKNPPRFAFDFHSPWHIGERNDNVFIVRRGTLPLKRQALIGRLLEQELTEGAMYYRTENDMPANTDWNRDRNPTFATFASRLDGCELAFTLETTYYGTPEHPVSGDRLVELGRCFARALRRYLAEKAKGETE